MKQNSPEEVGKSTQVRILAREFDIRAGMSQSPPFEPGRITEKALIQQRENQARAFQTRSARNNLAVRLQLNEFGLPKSMSRQGGVLSAPSKGLPEEIAKSFLRAHREVFPLSEAEVSGLRLLRRETAHGLTFLRFNQTMNDVDVFQGQVRIVLNGDGQVIEAGVGSVVPDLSAVTTPRLAPEEAVRAAFEILELPAPASLNQKESPRKRAVTFEHPSGEHLSPITTELSIFPMNAKSALLAYRILLEVDGSNWYEMLLDADTGRLLFLHNLYSWAASGRIWRESPLKGERELIEFSAGWLPSDQVVSTGNNVDAYLDSDGDNKPDTTEAPDILNGRATSAQQQFDFRAGERTTLENPRDFKAASVTSLFYFVNLAHDYFYQLGFNEAAGNFQKDNFDRGGIGGDPVMAEAQDGKTSNNASFASTPDGISPRLQTGLFTYGLYDEDSYTDAAYDGMVVIHEYAHGVTNRMIGGGKETSCLAGTQSKALGEGWSDYFAISFFNNPVCGAYSGLDRFSGLRRSSYERYPYTYEDLGNHGFEVHNDGEIWAGTLWDLRKTLGREAADQLVFEALRLTPCGPSMPDARNAIVTADENINGGANRAMLWKVFARHGLGFSAAGVDGNWRQGTVFTAGYDAPPGLEAGNRPPLVTNRAIAPLPFGTEFVYGIQAKDPEGGTLQYEMVKGPTGMTVNSNTGEIRWQTAFVGREAQFAVADGQGGRVLHGFRVHVETPLSPDTPLPISAVEGSAGLARFEVPKGTLVLQATLRGGWGDADLRLLNPDGVVHGSSSRDGNTETLTVSAPKAGTWIIEVSPYRNFANVLLTASLPVPKLLTRPVALTDLSGELSSETVYKIVVQEGESFLKVSTTGGDGDVDLYVRRNAVPVCQASASAPCLYDFRSRASGNTENIQVDNPAAGDYYVTLVGFEAYSNVTLTIPDPSAPVVSTAQLSFPAMAARPGAAPEPVTITAGGAGH